MDVTCRPDKVTASTRSCTHKFRRTDDGPDRHGAVMDVGALWKDFIYLAIDRTGSERFVCNEKSDTNDNTFVSELLTPTPEAWWAEGIEKYLKRQITGCLV